MESMETLRNPKYYVYSTVMEQLEAIRNLGDEVADPVFDDVDKVAASPTAMGIRVERKTLDVVRYIMGEAVWKEYELTQPELTLLEETRFFYGQAAILWWSVTKAPDGSDAAAFYSVRPVPRIALDQDKGENEGEEESEGENEGEEENADPQGESEPVAIMEFFAKALNRLSGKTQKGRHPS